MARPPSPGDSGPTFAPPTLPTGWIAQWDAASQKYYYVQLSTGASSWEEPDATGSGGKSAGGGGPDGIDYPSGTKTPANIVGKTPYGSVPPTESGAIAAIEGATAEPAPDGSGAQILTHKDGSQTWKHPDGSMEPLLPTENGSRGIDGPAGERGLGVCVSTFASRRGCGSSRPPSWYLP